MVMQHRCQQAQKMNVSLDILNSLLGVVPVTWKGEKLGLPRLCNGVML